MGEHGALLDRIALPPGRHDTTLERTTALLINGVAVACDGVMWGGSGDDDAAMDGCSITVISGCTH